MAATQLPGQLVLFAAPLPTGPRRTRAERNRARIAAAGKICSGKCGRWRPLHDFHAAAGRTRGRQSRCKRCMREGKVSAAANVETKRSCKACLSLAHRRPRRGCARCGEPYRALEVEIEQLRREVAGSRPGGFNYPNTNVMVSE